MSITPKDLSSSFVLLHLKKDDKNPNIYYLPKVACRDGRFYDLKIEVLEGEVLDSAFHLKKEDYLKMVDLFSKVTSSEEPCLEGGIDSQGKLFARHIAFYNKNKAVKEMEESLKEELKKSILEPLFGAFFMKKLFAEGTLAKLMFEVLTSPL